MITTLTITLCILLLVAYLFDLSAAKTKIPSVILLLFLGWGIKTVAAFLDFQLPNLEPILPAIGTVGLILIVLEGSLELEIEVSKKTIILKSFLGALLPILLLSLLFTYLFHYIGGYNLKTSLVNAIPLCVISSAVAIPSVRALHKNIREFVTYESSLSDIIGVILFNFIALNVDINANSFGNFAWQILIILFVSIIATIALSFLINKINHHVKFLPIIITVVLIYSISKIYHLPGLIFILILGIYLKNPAVLNKIKWIQKFHPEKLTREVIKLNEITSEFSFLVRSLFFLLFGFLLKTEEILSTESLGLAFLISASIIAIRVIQLFLSKIPIFPLLFIAPRGLITILLFLSIDPSQKIGMVTNSLIIQVIIIMAILMMLGLMIYKEKETEKL